MTQTQVTLANLRVHQTALVVGLDPHLDPVIAQRLNHLGFTPGTLVHVIRRAPLRDPWIYRIAGYDIALRSTQAQSILIEPSS